MRPTLIIPQGDDCEIVVDDIVDRAGNSLTVTGWSVRAQARFTPNDSVLLAEWVTGTPTGLQGQATAIGRTVTLIVPGLMSDMWTWTIVELGIRITEPVSPFRRKRFDARIFHDHSVVHA